MKAVHVLLPSLFIVPTLALPTFLFNKRDVDPNLVPQLGLQAGLNPTGTGDCDGIPGANGVPIKIPCQCPPNRTVLLQSLNANVAAGHAVNNPSVKVTFPTDNSFQSQQDRITAVAITLQNIDGPGKGCPIVSTTLTAQSQAIAAAQKAAESQSQNPTPPQSQSQSPSQSPVSTSSSPAQSSSAPPPPPPSSTSPPPAAVTSAAPSPSSSSGVNPALVPELGLQSGLNPTGTGDCDGIPGSNGVPIKIPCSCPPNRSTLLTSLSANVAAGHAINNPTVQISFPTDNSTQSQLARITAVVITLQNIDGPGKGCPLVSTTLAAQAQAIQDAASSSSAASAPKTPVAAPPSTPSSTPAAVTPSSVAPSLPAQSSVPASSGSSNSPGAPPSQASAPAASVPTSSPADSCSAASNNGASSSQSQSVNLSNSGNKNNGNNNDVNSALPATNVTLDPALVPNLGGVAGVNPTGTGDCDGVVKQANGQPIKVPCSCPPDQDAFIAALDANVAAGHAVHNPSVSVSFPLGNSSHAQFDRIEAAIVTLQNLNGPGQGCPVASTTLGQQQADVLNQINSSR